MSAGATVRDRVDGRDELVAMVGDFAAAELRPNAGRLDQGDPETCAETWRSCCDVGLDRALAPEDAGGAGLDAATFCRLLAELAYGDAGVAVRVMSHNVALRVLGIARAPDPDRDLSWVISLPPLGMPRTEPVVVGARDAGGAVVVEMERDIVPETKRGEDGETEAGQQTAATTVEEDLPAERAQTEDVVGRRSAVRVFFGPIDGAAITAEPLAAQLGLRSAAAATLDCDRASLPELNGDLAAPAHAEARRLVLGGLAAIATGVARDAEQRAAAYAAVRQQSGGPIARFDAVKLLLARARSAADLGEGLLVAGDLEHRSSRALLSAKIEVTDAALWASIDAVQVLGGYGYMTEQGVEKLMRDAAYLRLIPEPNRAARLLL